MRTAKTIAEHPGCARFLWAYRKLGGLGVRIQVTLEGLLRGRIVSCAPVGNRRWAFICKGRLAGYPTRRRLATVGNLPH